MWQYWFWSAGVAVLISPYLWWANQGREPGPWEILLEKRMDIRDEHLSLINPIQRGLQAQTSNCCLRLGEKVEGFPQALDDQHSIENTQQMRYNSVCLLGKSLVKFFTNGWLRGRGWWLTRMESDNWLCVLWHMFQMGAQLTDNILSHFGISNLYFGGSGRNLWA